MLSATRHDKILETLQQEKGSSTAALSKLIKVTEATIRQDFNKLESQGLIKRIHGGAILTKNSDFELSYNEYKERFNNEKQRIAEAASRFISDGDTILLDASTTVLQIAKRLDWKYNLVVITNAPDIILELAGKNNFSVISTGGMLRAKSMSLVGPTAESNLEELRANTLFIGINGITFEEGITTVSPLEAQVKKAMIRSSKQVIGVTDSSKFGKVESSIVGPLTILNKIITDKNIPEKYLKNFEKKGIELIIV